MLQAQGRRFGALIVGAALALPLGVLAQTPQPGAKPPSGTNIPPVTAPTKDAPG